MTYGLCADVHAHNWSQFSSLVDAYDFAPDKVNNRLKGIMDEFDRLCAATSKVKGKRVYIAGDLFHVRGNLKTSVINYVAVRMRASARNNRIQVVIMPGNHDLEDSEVTWFGNAAMMMDDIGDHDVEDQWIRVVQEPTFFEDDMVAIVPWQNTRHGLARAIDEIATSIVDDYGHSIFNVDLHLHTGINGVLVGMPDHGWSSHELADFGFRRVFCGHYHQHKVFNIPSDVTEETPVVSIGSLTHQTWSDVGTTSGWLIVTNDSFYHSESVQPKFMDFDGFDDLKKYSGNYVRVRGLELEESEIKTLRDALEDVGVKGVVIQAVSKSKIVTRSGRSASKAVRMETSVSDWIEENDPDNKEDVLREALDVLSEVRGAA